MPVYSTHNSISLLSEQKLLDEPNICIFRLSKNNHLIIDKYIKDCFEYFINQKHEADSTFIQDIFTTSIRNSAKEPALSQILDLWHRYFNYHHQLENLQLTDNFKAANAQYYRSIFKNIQNLRQQFFTEYEIQYLFPIEENIYHLYIFNRIDILTNNNLTETQKALKLNQLFKNLPIEWQIRFEQPDILNDLTTLTQEILARGGSIEELHKMRLNLLGTKRTQHFESIEYYKNSWTNRVNQYLHERDRILYSNMDTMVKEVAIQHLRKKHFSEASEQARLMPFEYMYDLDNHLRILQ